MRSSMTFEDALLLTLLSLGLLLSTSCSRGDLNLPDRGVSAETQAASNLRNIRDSILTAVLTRNEVLSSGQFSAFVTNQMRDSISRYSFGGAGLEFVKVSLRTNDWLTALTNVTSNGKAAKSPENWCLIVLAFKDEQGNKRHLTASTDGQIVRSNLVIDGQSLETVFERKP
jgi:hypothetical protein